MTPSEFCKERRAAKLVTYADDLTEAGFSYVVPRDWEVAHRFMRNRFGEGNYTWTGEKFWFTKDQKYDMLMLLIAAGSA